MSSDPMPGIPSPSSYEVIDEIVQYLELAHPNLRRVDVAGYSTGADLGLLWSILSSNGYRNVTNGGVRMRILLGSPTVYMYLNDRRPALACNPPITPGAKGRSGNPLMQECRTFLVPGSGSLAGSACKNYNEFPYGLGGLESVQHGSINKNAASSHYLHEYMDESMAKAELPAHFATKDVVFFVGSQDTDSCERDGSCPRVCGADLQGHSRQQRGLNYMGHLRDVLPGYEPQLQLFGGAHSPEDFFQNSVWADSAFGALPGDPNRGDLSVAQLFSTGFLALWLCLCFSGFTCLAAILFGIYRNSQGYAKNPESYEDMEEQTEEEDEHRHREMQD